MYRVFNAYMEHSNDLELPVFDQLECVTTDPVVERVFTMAREFEQMINYVVDTTPEERIALTEELDAAWPYLGSALTVSGNVSFQDLLDDEVRRKYYDETEMISNGFIFVPNNIVHDNEVVSTQYKVGLHLIKSDDNDRNKKTFGCGHLDDLHIEYPTNSNEMIERRLRYFHPDVIEALDCIMLNCNTEEEAVMAIGEFSMNITIENDDDIQMLSDIQNYISKSLEFDEELPYRFSMSGRCFVRGENAIKPIIIESETHGLAQINSIQFLPKDITKPLSENQEVIPCVDMNVFQPVKHITPQRMMVPIASMSLIGSLRREAYDA